MIKQYFSAIFLSIAFVLLLLFLNSRNSLNFVEEQKAVPTTIPTLTETQWQTYRNEKYGFEFQYPNDYFLKYSASLEMVFLSTKNFDIPETWGNSQLTDINISIGSESVEKRVQSYTDNVYGKNFTKQKLTNPLIGYMLDGFGEQMPNPNVHLTEYFLQVPKQSKVLNISYTNSEIPVEIFNKIISTFKFTQPNFCGGIAGIACSTGYKCILDGQYPDAGGKCQK